MIQRVERGEPIQKWVPTYRLYELRSLVLSRESERDSDPPPPPSRPHSFGLPAPVYMNWHPFPLPPLTSLSPCRSFIFPLLLSIPFSLSPVLPFHLSLFRRRPEKSNRPKNSTHDCKAGRPVVVEDTPDYANPAAMCLPSQYATLKQITRRLGQFVVQPRRVVETTHQPFTNDNDDDENC